MPTKRKRSKPPAPKAPEPSTRVSMSLTLAMKLGSIAVHSDEMTSSGGHSYDAVALSCLLRDPEVEAWIKVMGALLPRKRIV